LQVEKEALEAEVTKAKKDAIAAEKAREKAEKDAKVATSKYATQKLTYEQEMNQALEKRMQLEQDLLAVSLSSSYNMIQR
jgi:phage terminase Nu1 subunit (DNA packaging protein)